jgi:hypothetical protein
MKTISKLTICMAITAIALMGCDGKSLTGGKSTAKLSPPSWIQGDWGFEDHSTVYYRFTSNDVLLNIGVLTSLKDIYGYSVLGYGTTLKETKNSSSEYELKVTAKANGKEEAAGRFHFKKLDANHIEVGSNDEGDTITDWSVLEKK